MVTTPNRWCKAPLQEDQAWYLLEGSARTAAAEAKAVMETAMQALTLKTSDLYMEDSLKGVPLNHQF